MSQQLQITGGAKVRDLQDVIIGTSGVLSSLAFNVANGVPKLDVNGKILVSQLPNSVMEYLGTWDASTNTPTLVNGTGNQGDVYLCNVAGTVNFGAGPITFAVGDSAIYSGTIWQKAGGATGTVTSVGLTSTGNDAITITGSPITTSGNINLGFAGTNLQYINGAGDLTTFPTLISSIGLTMPSAFSVANSPLTSNGTIAVTGAGFPSQYIRGDGTLADFPTSGGGGSSVSYYLNGGTSQGVIGGITYYEMSKIAVIGTGVDFPKTGDGLIVSFLTDAGDPAQLNIPAGNWNYEIYASMSANGGTPELYAELYVYDGTTFTLISTSSNEILYDGTTLNLYTFAMAVPATTLALTDRLAVKLYATNSGGKTTTVHTQDGHLCQIITTFSTGITALNGLTAQVQYFATGTSGTDFNISSATATHTFNIPDASASARGLITTNSQILAGVKTFNSGLSLRGGYYPVPIAGDTGLAGSGSGLSIISKVGSTIYTNNLDFGNSSNSYAFPNASGTIALTSSLASYVPYTGATANVDIGVNAFNGGAITTEFGYAFKILAGGTLYQTGYSVISSLADKISFTQSPSAGLLKAFSFDISAWANNSSYTYTLPAATGTLPLGTGTTNYHAKWTGTNTLGNSLIQDNGTNLSINRAIDSSTLLILKGIGATSSTYGLYLLNSASNTNFYINDAGNSYFGNSIGIGTSPTNLNMLDVLGAVKFSGQLTLGSTITNGTYTYTLPSATGTLALTSQIPTISGTTNYHAKFTGTNTIGNSLIWDNGTNVGIGNTNTSYTLDVSGTGRFTSSALNAVQITNTGVGHGMTGWAPTNTVASLGSYDASGNFAIMGFSSSASQNGLSLFGFIGVTDPTDSVAAILLNAGKKSGTGQAALGASETTFQLVNGGIGSQITVLGSGNVGIGTSSPDFPLVVKTDASANSIKIIGRSGGDGLLSFYGSNGTTAYLDFSVGATYVNYNAVNSQNYNWYCNSTLKMSLLTGGTLLIGGASATGAYDCALGNATANTYYQVRSANTNSLYGADTRGTWMGNLSSKEAYINCPSFVPGIDNATSCGSSSYRWSVVYAVNGSIQTSDERQKTDIFTSDLGLDFINKLNPVSYKWKVGGNDVEYSSIEDEDGKITPTSVATPKAGVRTHYGLIAQQVKEVLGDKDFGGFVHDKETDMMSLRYDQFISPLIKAIQEQQIQIQNLQEQINILAK